MDSSRDNPLLRFSTFWWGIGAFLIFAALLLLFLPFRGKETNLEDVAAAQRYATKAQVAEAEAANLSREAIEAAFAQVGKTLAASKPAAVEKPEQIVPGSATAQNLASSGSDIDLDAINNAGDPEAPIDEAVMAAGKAAFMVCTACHGQNGEGTPAGPPLADSEWVQGPVSNLILIQLRGLAGPISVKGTEYNLVMAPLAYQTDEQIASVLTYVRNSFGNKGTAVTPEQVKAFRGEVGKPFLKVEELVQP